MNQPDSMNDYPQKLPEVEAPCSFGFCHSFVIGHFPLVTSHPIVSP